MLKFTEALQCAGYDRQEIEKLMRLTPKIEKDGGIKKLLHWIGGEISYDNFCNASEGTRKNQNMIDAAELQYRRERWESLKSREQRLIGEREKLQKYKAKLKKKAEALSAKNATKQSTPVFNNTIDYENLKVNQDLDHLSEAVKELVSSFDGNARNYISQNGHQVYVEADKRYLKVLQRIMERDFANNPSRNNNVKDNTTARSTNSTSGGKEAVAASRSKNISTDVSNTNAVSSQQSSLENSVTYKRYTKNLKRLDNALGLIELQKSKALIKLARMKASLSHHRGNDNNKNKDTSNSLMMSSIYSSEETMESRLQQRRETLLKLQGTVREYLTVYIPQNVDALSKLQRADVLMENYNLKLKRQGYFTSKQNTIIRYLSEQYSRHLLVKALYVKDFQNQQCVNSLLSSVNLLLKETLMGSQNRTSGYHQIIQQQGPMNSGIHGRVTSSSNINRSNEENNKNMNLTVIHSRNVFLHELNNWVKDHSRSNLNDLTSSNDVDKNNSNTKHSVKTGGFDSTSLLLTWQDLLTSASEIESNLTSNLEAELQWDKLRKKMIVELNDSTRKSLQLLHISDDKSLKLGSISACTQLDFSLISNNYNRNDINKTDASSDFIPMQLHLTHPHIQDFFTKCSESKSALNSEFRSILREMAEYEDTLHREPAIAEDKNLFVHFFCNENRLLSRVEMLKRRASRTL